MDHLKKSKAYLGTVSDLWLGKEFVAAAELEKLGFIRSVSIECFGVTKR